MVVGHCAVHRWVSCCWLTVRCLQGDWIDTIQSGSIGALHTAQQVALGAPIVVPLHCTTTAPNTHTNLRFTCPATHTENTSTLTHAHHD